MVICSAEQSHERVGQLPHPDPSGSSFLQSSCHGEGDGAAEIGFPNKRAGRRFKGGGRAGLTLNT